MDIICYSKQDLLFPSWFMSSQHSSRPYIRPLTSVHLSDFIRSLWWYAEKQGPFFQPSLSPCDHPHWWRPSLHRGAPVTVPHLHAHPALPCAEVSNHLHSSCSHQHPVPATGLWHSGGRSMQRNVGVCCTTCIQSFTLQLNRWSFYDEYRRLGCADA